MLVPNNKEILDILESRVHEQEIYGYYGGSFSPDMTRFYAATYVDLATINVADFWVIFNYGGHSSIGVDMELKKKPIDAHSYQMKSTDECIEQKIYRAFSVKFFGAFYEGRWYILNELQFFGEQMPEEPAKHFLNRRFDSPDHWNSGPFQLGYSQELQERAEPMRDVEMEEFSGEPWLVAYLKVEQKRKVNRAFTSYVNTAIVEPFLATLRIQFREEFYEFIGLYSEGATLVFPADKRYFLAVTMARDQAKGYRLVWFFHDLSPGKFYRWTYPQPRYSEWHYAYTEDIIVDLRSVSEWNDCLFINSSRTMDDQNFWSEYVLKRADGKYVWLEEIG